MRVRHLARAAELAHDRCRHIAPGAVGQVDADRVADVAAADRRHGEVHDLGIDEAGVAQHRRQPAGIDLVEPIQQARRARRG
ncbi:hypothetical protein AB5I41_07520 [Sphingomonas sp. MMS24-JH45]